MVKLYQFLARTGKDFLSDSARGEKLGAVSAATHLPHLPLGLKKGSNFFQESRLRLNFVGQARLI